MSKKIFAFLLVAVFVLAQFGTASAAAVAGEVTVDALDTFHNGGSIRLDVSVVNMNPGSKYLVMWARLADSPANLWGYCEDWFLGDLGAGTSYYADWDWYDWTWYGDQDTVEFYVTVDSTNCGGGAAIPATSKAAMASTFIDDEHVDGFIANPPSINDVDDFEELNVACNTFELWGLATDTWHIGGPFTNDAYSGFDSWNEDSFGAFAPPAPEGSTSSLLEWTVTIPSSASGPWDFWVAPNDVADNGYDLKSAGPYFRNDTGYGATINGPEKQPCKDFTDAAGHADEVYFRYLGDLGILAGNPDGSFGPDNTLTRAEASVMFETANGYTAATLPTAAPAGCDFPDVTATDWFAGWVWQACDDGFMNGLADGTFDPSNTFTRGQAVTVLNNMSSYWGTCGGNNGSFLDNGNRWGCTGGTGNLETVLNYMMGYSDNSEGFEFREALWTDVAIGEYYAAPVVHAYGVGIAEGTSATTFSPNQPILRGEFAKMLYRALSRTDGN